MENQTTNVFEKKEEINSSAFIGAFITSLIIISFSSYFFGKIAIIHPFVFATYILGILILTGWVMNVVSQFIFSEYSFRVILFGSVSSLPVGLIIGLTLAHFY